MAIAKVIFNNGITSTVWMDVTQDTVVSSNLLSGESATRADGVSILGTYVPPSFSTMSSTFTPTETTTTITPATGYDGFSQVKINGISSTYVGTGITRRSAADLTSNGAYITAPIGYYSSAVSKAVATATQATPGITVNANGLVTATATQTAGYVTAGTKTSTYQMTSVAGTTITPTEASQLAVASSRFTKGSVYVGAISSTYVGTGVAQKSSADLIGAVGTTSYTVTAPAGYYSANATKNIAKYDIATPAISLNNMTGVITATVSQANAGYVPTGSATSTYQLSTISGSSITPTASDTWVAAPAGRYTLGNIYVQPIPSAYIIPSGTSNITSNGTYDITSYSAVSVSVAGGEYYTVYRSIANNQPILSSDVDVSAWANSLTSIVSSQFMGRRLSGNFNFDNVETIGDSAFCYLQNVSNYWNNYTFSKCTSVGSSAFYSNARMQSISLPSCTFIGQGAFQYCDWLSNVYMPMVQSIGMQAFHYCSLRTLNTSASTFGSSCFMYNRSLTIASVPECTSIVAGMFGSCTSLSMVDAPKCTTVGYMAFSGCTSLAAVSFSQCLTIGQAAFSRCNNLISVSLPECTKLNSNAFQGCTKLSDFYAPKVSDVLNGAFNGCASILSLSFPELSILRANAFASMANVSLIYVPNASTTQSSVFYKCSNVNTIVLSSVTGFGSSYIFGYCFNLLSLYLLGSSVATMGNTTIFSSTPISTYTTSTGGVRGSIFVRESLYDTYIAATNWKTYSARFVSMTDAQISAFLSSLG